MPEQLPDLLWKIPWVAAGMAALYFINQLYKMWKDRQEFKLALEKKRRELPKQEFSTEQIFEDASLGTGYKAILYDQDKRIRQLGGDIVELRAAHMKCIDDHARAEALAEERGKKLVAQDERIAQLESRLFSMEKTISPHRSVKPRDDSSSDKS